MTRRNHRLGDGGKQLPRRRTGAVRAVEAVDWIGTPEAVQLLKAWAGGTAGVRLTEDPSTALARIRRR
jgi:hypothetical protein